MIGKDLLKYGARQLKQRAYTKLNTDCAPWKDITDMSGHVEFLFWQMMAVSGSGLEHVQIFTIANRMKRLCNRAKNVFDPSCKRLPKLFGTQMQTANWSLTYRVGQLSPDKPLRSIKAGAGSLQFIQTIVPMSPMCGQRL